MRCEHEESGEKLLALKKKTASCTEKNQRREGALATNIHLSAASDGAGGV